MAPIWELFTHPSSSITSIEELARIYNAARWPVCRPCCKIASREAKGRWRQGQIAENLPQGTSSVVLVLCVGNGGGPLFAGRRVCPPI